MQVNNNFTAKYRPKEPRQVIGKLQRQVAESLLRRVEEGNFVQSLLLLGPFGTGKTTIARMYAEALLGKPYGKALGIDLIHVSCKDKGGVGFVRETILPQFHIRPFNGEYTIFFLDEIHNLTSDAVDALHVSLENIPNHLVFIGASTEPQTKLNEGLVSRFQEKHTFRAPSRKEMARLIKGISSAEDREVPEDIIDQLIDSANGNVRQLVANVGSYFAGVFNYTPTLDESDDLVSAMFAQEVDISRVLKLQPGLNDFIGLMKYAVAVIRNGPKSRRAQRAQEIIIVFGDFVVDNIPDNNLFDIVLTKKLLLLTLDNSD